VAKVIDNANLIHESSCGVTAPSVLKNSQHSPEAATEIDMSIIQAKKDPGLLARCPNEHDKGQDNYRPPFVPDNITPPNLLNHRDQNTQKIRNAESPELRKKPSASIPCNEYTAPLAICVGWSSLSYNTMGPPGTSA
jgi:hypothetical protein